MRQQHGTAAGGKKSRQGRRKSTRSVLSRQGCRRRRQKDLIGLERMCCLGALIRDLQNLDILCKGFNCCGAKLQLRCADLRFAKPRNSLRKRRFYVLFASCKKNQKARQRFANLWTPGTIQIAGRYVILAEITGNHQVTGYARSCNFAGYRRQ